tara:strand:- start:92 stop:502 length:411 start_codon:yes stop_codon:yes gene_type:complete
MKKYLLILSLLSVSCLENKGDNDYSNETEQENYYLEEEVNNYKEDDLEEESYYYEEENVGYEDGTYTATVYYNNPETDYSATYTLDVEVEDNEVTIIYFPNDGYLDEDHIWPEELDDQGYVMIYGEEGKTYEIQID